MLRTPLLLPPLCLSAPPADPLCGPGSGREAQAWLPPPLPGSPPPLHRTTPDPPVTSTEECQFSTAADFTQIPGCAGLVRGSGGPGAAPAFLSRDLDPRPALRTSRCTACTSSAPVHQPQPRKLSCRPALPAWAQAYRLPGPRPTACRPPGSLLRETFAARGFPGPAEAHRTPPAFSPSSSPWCGQCGAGGGLVPLTRPRPPRAGEQGQGCWGCHAAASTTHPAST